MSKEFKELELPNGYTDLSENVKNAGKRIVLSKGYDDNKYSSKYKEGGSDKETIVSFSLSINESGKVHCVALETLEGGRSIMDVFDSVEAGYQSSTYTKRTVSEYYKFKNGKIGGMSLQKLLTKLEDMHLNKYSSLDKLLNSFLFKPLVAFFKFFSILVRDKRTFSDGTYRVNTLLLTSEEIYNHQSVGYNILNDSRTKIDNNYPERLGISLFSIIMAIPFGLVYVLVQNYTAEMKVHDLMVSPPDWTLVTLLYSAWTAIWHVIVYYTAYPIAKFFHRFVRY